MSKSKKDIGSINELQAKRYLRAIVDTYMSVQTARIAGENRLRAIKQLKDEPEIIRIQIMEYMEGLKSVEEDMQRAILLTLRNQPIWTEFLFHVRGVGPTLAGKLLALNLNPEKNLSSWTAYMGLTTHYWVGLCEKNHNRFYSKDPLICLAEIERDDDGNFLKCGAAIKEKEHVENKAPARKRGYFKFWSSRARNLVFLFARQFILAGGFYEEQYRHFKERENTNHPEFSDGRRDNSAKRKTVQLFIAHLYQAMHELRGTEARIPYQFEYLKHSLGSFIDWKDVVKYDMGKKKVKA